MRKKKTTEEFKREVYEKVGNEYTVLGEYINANTKIRMRHNCDKCNNFEWDVKPNNFINNNTRCPMCFGTLKKTTEQFKKEIFNTVGEEYTVLGEYINAHTKIEIKHNVCGYIYEVTPNNFISSNTRCPMCFGTLKKTTEQFKKEIFNTVGEEYIVLGEYVNAHTKIKMRHNRDKCRNFEWEIIPDSFLRGARCPWCAGCIKKTTRQFKKEIYNLVNNEYSIVGNYVNCKTKIRMKHNTCGHEWDIIPNSFLRGCRCPWCNQSSKEKEITKYLENKNIFFDIEYSLEGLIDKRPLSFDFAIFDKNDNLKLLLEYHGTQHFYDKWNNEKRFKGVQKRDQLKIDYCYENNIPLLMIPYTEDKNIEEILQETLTNLGLLPEK